MRFLHHNARHFFFGALQFKYLCVLIKYSGRGQAGWDVRTLAEPSTFRTAVSPAPQWNTSRHLVHQIFWTERNRWHSRAAALNRESSNTDDGHLTHLLFKGSFIQTLLFPTCHFTVQHKTDMNNMELGLPLFHIIYYLKNQDSTQTKSVFLSYH